LRSSSASPMDRETTPRPIHSRQILELTYARDPYFLDFINLPARTNKEYFAVITSPLSLKGLQKQIKGVHGRQAATGISDFKGWAAFEERASLLWENAHYYNEEGSSIYEMATELKVRRHLSPLQTYPYMCD